MFGVMIANLVIEECKFEIPSSLGKWEFNKTGNYDQLIKAMNNGMCGNTFKAFHTIKSETMIDSEFSTLYNELIDSCLILSFITAKCVTVSKSAPNSSMFFIPLEGFIRSRAIQGFSSLPVSLTLSQLFQSGINNLQFLMKKRNLRLFLSHWISGLTCFTIEDLFIATCVEMDIIKQCERRPCDKKSYSYYEGMQRASERYGINKLSPDYKNMRNDLILEGTLSGTNNKGKSKGECATIIADVLNWIDEYVVKILNIPLLSHGTRWNNKEIEQYLPSISLRQ